MFAGVADYGLYQRCCRASRKEKFAGFGLGGEIGGGGTHLSITCLEGRPFLPAVR